MTSDTLRLYHSPASPNSRRVRIFLAEKGVKIPLVAVDLGKGEQHSDTYTRSVGFLALISAVSLLFNSVIISGCGTQIALAAAAAVINLPIREARIAQVASPA
jgi:Glutathione S-transferase, N-terminal domain